MTKTIEIAIKKNPHGQESVQEFRIDRTFKELDRSRIPNPTRLVGVHLVTDTQGNQCILKYGNHVLVDTEATQLRRLRTVKGVPKLVATGRILYRTTQPAEFPAILTDYFPDVKNPYSSQEKQIFSALRRPDVLSRLATIFTGIHRAGVVHLDAATNIVIHSERAKPYVIDFNNSKETQRNLYRLNRDAYTPRGNKDFGAPEVRALARTTDFDALSPLSDVYEITLFMYLLFAEQLIHNHFQSARTYGSGYVARESEETLMRNVKDIAPRYYYNRRSRQIKQDLNDIFTRGTKHNPTERKSNRVKHNYLEVAQLIREILKAVWNED